MLYSWPRVRFPSNGLSIHYSCGSRSVELPLLGPVGEKRRGKAFTRGPKCWFSSCLRSWIYALWCVRCSSPLLLWLPAFSQPLLASLLYLYLSTSLLTRTSTPILSLLISFKKPTIRYDHSFNRFRVSRAGIFSTASKWKTILQDPKDYGYKDGRFYLSTHFVTKLKSNFICFH